MQGAPADTGAPEEETAVDRLLVPISPTEKPEQVSPGATSEASTRFPDNVTVVDPAELENKWYNRLQEVEDEPEWE